ncbi:MAG: YkgJ family cysteine cluster protein [Polyangiaceae bacterium]
MKSPVTVRPVVRSFKAPFAAEAAAWARSGGHSVLWETPSRARLVMRKPSVPDMEDVGFWSILDLGGTRYTMQTKGALRGLATFVVPKDCHHVVIRRAERDSEHRGPTRKVSFDCLACGACCRDNEVIVYADDEERLVDGGHADVTKPPYARRRKDGKLVLTMAKATNACHHLGPKDNMCGIYEARPDACRDFPMGSECCMFAREDELELYDGVAPGA